MAWFAFLFSFCIFIRKLSNFWQTGWHFSQEPVLNIQKNNSDQNTPSFYLKKPLALRSPVCNFPWAGHTPHPGLNEVHHARHLWHGWLAAQHGRVVSQTGPSAWKGDDGPDAAPCIRLFLEYCKFLFWKRHKLWCLIVGDISGRFVFQILGGWFRIFFLVWFLSLGWVIPNLPWYDQVFIYFMYFVFHIYSYIFDKKSQWKYQFDQLLKKVTGHIFWCNLGPTVMGQGSI